MFSLDGTLRYWLYSEPTDMRKSFHTLSGIVNNRMESDVRNGDMYIFVNGSADNARGYATSHANRKKMISLTSV